MNISEIEILEVSVHYGETKSLPDYSNTKPGYSLKAAIKPGQDPEEVKAALAEQVRRWTWEDIDQALEREGMAAKFSTEARFDVLHVSLEKYIAIIPAGAKDKLPKPWDDCRTDHAGWRLAALHKLYQGEDYSGFTVEDFSNGDFSLLPTLVEFQVISHLKDNGRYLVLLPGDTDSDSLPDAWKYDSRRYYTRFVGPMIHWAASEAEKNKAVFINCLDGDLSRLPDLSPKEAPAPEIEPDYDEPIDEDWDDDNYEGDDD